MVYDESHQTSPYPKDDVIEWFEFVNKCIEKSGTLEKTDYKKVLDKMKSKAEIKKPEDFDTIRGISKTDEIIKEFKLDRQKLSSRFLLNENTLVFAPNGLRCTNSKFRTDPYAGMLCAFDIMFCRDNNFNRKMNLLLICKNVKKSEINFTDVIHKDEECPFINTNISLNRTHLNTCCFTQAKYRRIYGEVADVIIFDDGIFYNGGEE